MTRQHHASGVILGPLRLKTGDRCFPSNIAAVTAPEIVSEVLCQASTEPVAVRVEIEKKPDDFHFKWSMLFGCLTESLSGGEEAPFFTRPQFGTKIALCLYTPRSGVVLLRR